MFSVFNAADLLLYSVLAMGFSLLDEGATVPPFPHITCVDGFAWADEEARRPCFSASVSAPTRIVAQAIAPSPTLSGVDTILAVATLNHVQICRIFSADCRHCQVDHQRRALKCMKAARDYIHPDAIKHLRNAMVPEYLLLQPWIVNEDILRPDASEAEQKAFQRRSNFLPLWRKDPERTLAAQIAFAMQYAKKKSSGRPRGRPARAVTMHFEQSTKPASGSSPFFTPPTKTTP